MGNADGATKEEEDLFFFGKDDDFIVVLSRVDDDGATTTARAVDAFADAAHHDWLGLDVHSVLGLDAGFSSHLFEKLF